ncbi:methylamine utilization protein [Tamilnaduibacter salinus]|nr:methylamine utilization protein [Tamilnaduibacter salinus]
MMIKRKNRSRSRKRPGYPGIVGSVMVLLAAVTPARAEDLSVTVIDRHNGEPLKNAVVSVEGGPSPPPLPEPAIMGQRNRAFQPHVMVIPKGTQVTFPNHDQTKHHVYSFSPAKTFNIELYSGRPKQPITFDKAGIVELGCNIHDQMQAFIVVTDGASAARTGEDGTARLTGVPEGTNQLHVWHLRLPDNATRQQRTIDGRDAVTVELTVRSPPEDDQGMQGLQERFDSL